MKQCFLCGLHIHTETHHIFFGRANRKLSDKYGLVVNLCPECHRTGKHAVHGAYGADNKQKLFEYGQRKFMREQNASIADFVKIFGKNYLDESW